jgi:hypothetical protein
VYNLRKLSALLILVSSLYLPLVGQAYVQNRTPTDGFVHWTNNISVIDIFVNSSNTQSFSTSTADSIVGDAIAQWNGKSRLTLRQYSTAATAQDNLNEVYFSTDPNLFGGGSMVVGVTQVYFKNNTGEIIEADILLNDNYGFSTNQLASNYLGNVITHEMGHLLGLGHSQVIGSTMFYSLSRGQNQLDPDDKAGIYSIYPNGDSTKASLTGKMIGGASLVSVYGAHVEAISLKTGKIAGSSISDVDGRFTIDGLDKNDQYYIYNSPVIQSAGLPSRFDNARNDFCTSSKKYRGSFFQGCSSSNEGYPQVISLNSTKVDVGNVTIRCGLDVPVNYISLKNDLTNTFDLQDGVLAGLGNSFIGYFSNQEMALNSVSDQFKMDLSFMSESDWLSLAPSGNLFVELKILNQSFYSTFKANIDVTRPQGSHYGVSKYTQASDGWLNIESIIRVPIIRADPSDNVFSITVTPENMTSTKFPTGLVSLSTKDDYFPAAEKFEDSLKFYLVSASIVKDNGSGGYDFVNYKNKQWSDNTSCPDAANTYALTNYSATGIPSSSKKKSNGIGCGTVDLDGGPGNGPGGFFIGLILSLILCTLASVITKNNEAKH